MYATRRLKFTKTRCLCFQTVVPSINCFSFLLFTDNHKNLTVTRMTDPQPQPIQEKKCSFVKDEVIASGKWLALNKITYKDPAGKERLWEAVSRTTKQTSAASDAVCAIPILKRLLHYDSVILVKQYRPPVKAYTVEFPAGLLDPGEGPETCAIRELKEETGYTGVAKHTSPATTLDPGLGNTTVQLITVEIDGDSPENKNHSQKTEEGEFIEVLTVPLDGMLDKLNELASEGLFIDSRVYSYAVAREQQKNLKPAI